MLLKQRTIAAVASVNRHYRLLLLSFLANCIVINLVNQQSNPIRLGKGSGDEISNQSAELRLGDDCYHVFLDVGANIGVHTRFLFEPHLYPEADIAHGIYDLQFGPVSMRDNRDICAFAFEPNPNHAETLQRTSEAYLAQGWRYHPIHEGVGDRDDSIVFHRNDLNGANSEWGFSVKHFSGDNNVEKLTIPVRKLSRWLKTHIASRQVPQQPYGNYTNGPKVLMKMDIEGMEYLVLPDLMLSGAFCIVDYIFGEFHAAFAPLSFPGHRVWLNDIPSAQQFGESMIAMMHASRECNTTFVYADDESYLKDGMPLPGTEKNITAV